MLERKKEGKNERKKDSYPETMFPPEVSILLSASLDTSDEITADRLREFRCHTSTTDQVYVFVRY
jgi:hypothetical protein